MNSQFYVKCTMNVLMLYFLAQEAFKCKDVIARSPIKEQDSCSGQSSDKKNWVQPQTSDLLNSTPQSIPKSLGNQSATESFQELSKKASVPHSKGFLTPAMFSMANFTYDETPLEDIRPPVDFNMDSVRSERQEIEKSRILFRLDTPTTNIPLAKEFKLDISTSEATTDNHNREFQLIPVNIDDLLGNDDYLSPNVHDKKSGKNF